MIWRIFKEVLGVVGLVFLGWLGLSVVLSLEKPDARFEPRMTSPIQCDATVSQRGAGERWKTKCYVRSDK